MPIAGRAHALVVAALLPAAAIAQPEGSGRPRFTIAAAGGVGPAATVVAGQITTSGSFAAGAPTTNVTREFEDEQAIDLRLDTRTIAGAEARVWVGHSRRWAVSGQLAYSTGGAALQQNNNSIVSGSPLAVSSDRRVGSYDRATMWQGAVGVARAVSLAGAWAADLSVAGTVGWVRARTGPDVCGDLTGFALALCEQQAQLARPAFSVTMPGVGFGAALESPAWRGLRARARVGADVVFTDGAGLIRDLRPDVAVAVLYPEGYQARESASGRQARVLPAASVGVALGLGR